MRTAISVLGGSIVAVLFGVVAFCCAAVLLHDFEQTAPESITAMCMVGISTILVGILSADCLQHRGRRLAGNANSVGAKQSGTTANCRNRSNWRWLALSGLFLACVVAIYVKATWGESSRRLIWEEFTSDLLGFAVCVSAGSLLVTVGWLLLRSRPRAEQPSNTCARRDCNLNGNVPRSAATEHEAPGRSMRVHRVVLLASVLGLSWLGMMMVHELGHVLGARVSGGTVQKVFHDPFSFSYTLLGRNPRPLLVAWAGPVVGALLPLAAFGFTKLLKTPWRYLLRFFAGFCLLANGAYIGVGVFMPVADAADLLHYGAGRFAMAAFGVACMAGGLGLWHRLGPSFGFGSAKGKVSPVAAYSCLALLIATAVTMAQ